MRMITDSPHTIISFLDINILSAQASFGELMLPAYVKKGGGTTSVYLCVF